MNAYEVLFTLREDAEKVIYRTIYQTWKPERLQHLLEDEFGFDRVTLRDWRILHDHTC